MEKFNLKQFIAENKATFYSSLNENESTYEGKKSKEYYKDAEADDAEHIDALEKDMKDDKKASKMKVSELKSKIKEMIVAEYEKDVDYTDENPEKEVDFLSEIEAMLDEAEETDAEETTTDTEETEKDTAETDTEETTTDTETTDVETKAEVNPDVKAVQDALTQAQVAAQKLGDKKLTDQIGNTITFFTREHVVEKPKSAEAVAEELTEFLLLKKSAGIITESQYKAKLKEVEEVFPEQAASKAIDLIPKLKKSPEMDKLADKIANNPDLLKQLEKALAQGGVMMNEELKKLDDSDLKTLALNFAKKSDKLNETISSNPEEDTSSAGLGMLALIGGGTLGAAFSSAIISAIPLTGKLFAGLVSGPAGLGALVGVGLFILARKVYLKMNPDA